MNIYYVLLLFLAFACVVLYINFTYFSECSYDDTHMQIEALKRRVLVAESKNIKNAELLEKFMNKVQSIVGRLEEREMKELQTVSQGSAVMLALLLAQQPIPSIPPFQMMEEMKDPGKLADVIDDILADTTYFELHGVAPASEPEKAAFASDGEVLQWCMDAHKQYNVVVGKSWGTLPVELQHEWVEYSCDYRLK